MSTPHTVITVLRLLALLTFCQVLVGSVSHAAIEIVWPTPNPAFAMGLPWQEFVQPTASGDPTSALFGCVRNSGGRFHEGLDLKPILALKAGEATDPIYAALEGTVVHVSAKSGLSSYGRYVVLEHREQGLLFYTLYAHLAAIDPAIKKGEKVGAGTVLGTMGRSAAGYSIPRNRAHLHFEIGLRVSDKFQRWYDRQKFGSANHHGNYNGMNLLGFDPLAFYTAHRDGGVHSVGSYIRELPTAYVLRVSAPEVPSFIKRNPALLTKALPKDGLVGWDIAFTWHGLPKQWTPLVKSEVGDLGEKGSVRLTAFNREEVEANSCRSTVRIKGGEPVVQGDAVENIRLLFDFR